MKRNWAIIVFCSLLIVHLFVLANLRFEAWPEMLIYPYLNLNGFLQYRDIIHPYPPGGIWFLSLFFKFAGLSVINLQLLTWGTILLIDILIFYIARKRWGSQSALIALGFFVVWQPLLDGNGLWFDLMLIPLLLTAFHRQSSLFLALSFFIKQSVIWLLPLFIKQWKKLFFLVLSLFLISYFLFLSRGNATDYLFWSWRFPFTIFPNMPGHKDLGNWRLWIIGLAPLLLALGAKISISKKLPRLSVQEPMWWMILSFPFILPRFGLFHFQPALAFAALSVAELRQKIKPWLLFATGYSLFAAIFWFRQIITYWHQPVRFFEPEIIRLAQEIELSTNPSQLVLYVNAPDQTMVIARRLPAKPWVDTFPWYLEIPTVQTAIVKQYQNQPIQAVIWSSYGNEGKFTPGSYQPEKLQQFIDSRFSKQHDLSNNTFLLTPP